LLASSETLFASIEDEWIVNGNMLRGGLCEWVSEWICDWGDPVTQLLHSLNQLLVPFTHSTHSLTRLLLWHKGAFPYEKSSDGMVAPLIEGPIVFKPSLTSSDPRFAYLSAVAYSFSVHPKATDLHRSRSLPHGCTSLKNHGPRREMRIWPLKAIWWTGRVVNVTAHVCLSPVMKQIWVGAYSVSKARVSFPRFIRVLFL
jgi:hypothetical protein